MKAARLASKIHKWLALIIAVPILLWFVSGLFISLVPMAAIHGDHNVRRHEPAGFQTGPLAHQLAAALQGVDGRVTRVDVREVLGRPMALVEAGEARPRLFDLISGRQVSPIDRTMALAIARADFAGPAAPVRAALLTDESRVYRGPLPVWRVDFDDPEATAIYIAADYGRVTARRNDLFGLYDAMWAMHILNWSDPEAINSWWLWGSAAAALVVAISGVVLLPSRLGFGRRRRLATMASR